MKCKCSLSFAKKVINKRYLFAYRQLTDLSLIIGVTSLFVRRLRNSGAGSPSDAAIFPGSLSGSVSLRRGSGLLRGDLLMSVGSLPFLRLNKPRQRNMQEYL